MPVTFLNGDSPLYLGYQFTTSTDLIDTIESTLVAAGWTSLSKVSGTSLFIRGVTAINSHNCWIEFVVSGATTAKTLTMRGWLEAAKTNGSPGATHTLTYTEESLNRIWLTADQDAFCISIYNATGAMDGYHAGFLARLDTTDSNAWMIGRIISYPSYTTAYVARSKHNSTIWRQLSADFTNYSSLNYGAWGFVPGSTFNRNLLMGATSIAGNNIFSLTDTSNVLYQADIGRRNPDGNCEITPYYYREGRGSTTAYGSSMGGGLYYRGDVKFAYCGVSQEAAAAQVVDAVTGYRILSVGGNASQAARQGMRIL